MSIVNPPCTVESSRTTIKELRKELNISQDEVANDLGISRITINRWESEGISSIKVSTLLDLCEYFGVEPGDLAYR